MKKEIRFYNIIFPIWMVLFFPITWLVIIPANFIIDSIVLLIALRALHILHSKRIYKRTILKVWIFGFLSDIIGAGCCLGLMHFFDLGIIGEEPIITIPGVIIAAVMIFIFNYFISFKWLGKKDRFKLALIMALTTAPYTFLIPWNSMYF